VKHSEKTGDDIFIKPLSSSEEGTPIVQGPSDQNRPDFEPSGRFMAYSSEESGRLEIYITRVPAGEGRWQASVNGGRRARWSPTGDRLYFQSLDSNTLLEVDVTLGQVPTLGTPRVVLDMVKSSLKTWGGCNYDVDGANRFIALMFPPDLSEQGNVIVVENWAKEFAKNK
jgi:Tol biopolymer transport system component